MDAPTFGADGVTLRGGQGATGVRGGCQILLKADGRTIAKRLAGLMRDEGGKVLRDAPMEAVGVAGGTRGRGALSIVFPANCPPVPPSSSPQRPLTARPTVTLLAEPPG